MRLRGSTRLSMPQGLLRVLRHQQEVNGPDSPVAGVWHTQCPMSDAVLPFTGAGFYTLSLYRPLQYAILSPHPCPSRPHVRAVAVAIAAPGRSLVSQQGLAAAVT